MKQIRTARILVLATALVLPHAAWSDAYTDDPYGFDNTFNSNHPPAEVEGYLGGGIGLARIDDQDFLNDDDSVQDERRAWKVFGGIDAGRVLAIELGYVDFGELQDAQTSLEASGWTLAGIIALPITENFSPYGKAGQFYWDADFTVGGIGESISDDDFFYGFGGRFALNDWSDIRLEYERFDLDDTPVDLASLNLQIRF